MMINADFNSKWFIRNESQFTIPYGQKCNYGGCLAFQRDVKISFMSKKLIIILLTCQTKKCVVLSIVIESVHQGLGWLTGELLSLQRAFMKATKH